MRAIILAAGMGTRLRPLTLNTPKSLVKINEKPLIETQIEYLHEIGIKDITIVVGYLAEKFDYLVEKYKVNIIFNRYYDKYNNIYTMSLVIDKLADSYVIDADVFMRRNFLQKAPKTSLYFSGMKNTKNEWALDFDSMGKVYNIHLSNGNEYIMSGVSFWTKEDSNILSKKLKEKITQDEDSWNKLYWDDIVKENLSLLDVNIHKIDSNDWYEIDSISDYNFVINLK